MARRSALAPPLFGDPNNPLTQGAPTLADAWSYNANAYGDWLAQQRTDGVAKGLIDPATGWPTQNALIDAAKQWGGAMLGSTSAPGAKMPPIIAYHGSNAADLPSLDLSKTGTGAFVGRFGPDNVLDPQAYLATERSHAAYYGDHVHKFSIDAPLLEKNAVPELESWAKDLGHKNAQDMIDKYFDGSAYDALNADEYFTNATREAKAAGLPGARVSFGDLKDSVSGTSRKIGDVIILHDPSVATKVED